MYRIDNETSVASLPTPDAVGTPNRYFSKGVPGSVPATIVDQDWANAVQEELCYVITQSGATLSKTDRTQLLTAIKSFIQGDLTTYVASTTAANTYTATPSPALTAYVTGQRIFIKFTNHNTGAATINLNSLGAKSIKHPDGTALNSNDIADGMVAALVYDGTNFQLINTNPGNYSRIIDLQNGANVYAASSSSANTYTATISPALTAYTAGLKVRIKFTNHNTGAATLNLNSLGAVSIKHPDGTALNSNDIADGMVADLVHDGTNFQLINTNPGNYVTITKIQSGEYVYSASSSSANTYTATPSPALTGYTTGMQVVVKFTNANTGAATLNLNSLGAVNIKKPDGSALSAGNIAAGMIGVLLYDGTNFQLANPSGGSFNSAFMAQPSAQADNVTGNGTDYNPVVLGTEVYDAGNEFASNVFTAGNNGIWIMHFEMHILGILSAHTLCAVELVTSNRSYYGAYVNPYNMFPGSGSDMILSGCFVVDMDANDTAKIRFRTFNGTLVVDVGTSTKFAGVQVKSS